MQILGLPTPTPTHTPPVLKLGFPWGTQGTLLSLKQAGLVLRTQG